MNSVDRWLENRSALKKRLDAIRSLGWNEHWVEARGRKQPDRIGVPSGVHVELPLLREGPWYCNAGELLEFADETYDFESTIVAHRRALADAKLLQDTSGRSDRELGDPAVTGNTLAGGKPGEHSGVEEHRRPNQGRELQSKATFVDRPSQRVSVGFRRSGVQLSRDVDPDPRTATS